MHIYIVFTITTLNVTNVRYILFQVFFKIILTFLKIFFKGRIRYFFASEAPFWVFDFF